MYQLTLSRSERRAIEWIGNRYANGDNLYSLLCDADWGNCRQWDEPQDITFTFHENVAWGMLDIREAEDGHWPCFSPELACKLNVFCETIT